jgi:HSP20 family protein
MNLTLKKRNGETPSLFSDWFNSNSLFGPMFGEMDTLMRPRQLGVTLPTANIRETDKEYVLELAAPGFNRNDLKIEVEDRLLTIWSEKKEEKKEEDDDYSRREFSYSSFSRSFSLPENSVGDKIDAKYTDGILRVMIPKKEAGTHKSRKQITIS